MEELILGFLCMFIALVIVPLFLWKRRHVSPHVDHHQQPLRHQAAAATEEVVNRRAPARRMRRRPAAGGASTSSAAAADFVEEAAAESDGPGDYYVAKAPTKKEKKRQEREAQRQAEEAARESRNSKQDRYADMRRKKDEDREAQERLVEEEAAARKAKEEEAAALEFDKWKGEFSVDAEGTTENELQDGSQGLLADFVEYIKKQKCVPLEDLAAEFKMRTLDCINRITALENMGRLSGVMDDRGKFIYISPEEMRAVADYIQRQGRVSISHLASKSNQFIDLEPKPQFVDEASNLEAIAAV